MNLRELLVSRDNWAENATIYLAEPWNGDAEAVLISKAPDAIDPIFQSGKRYTYFLEGFIARDFLDDLGASTSDVSEEACDQLIGYALNDA